MPDKDGFPTPDELINGPGVPEPTPKAPKEGPSDLYKMKGAMGPKEPILTADQQKAIEMVLSGLPFVCLAVRQTCKPGETTPSGADFLVAIDGDKDALRAAQEYLKDVIDRAFSRKGIV